MTAFVWGPTLDEATCTDCKVCLEFCQQGVYAHGRRSCARRGEGILHGGLLALRRLCEAGALTFPTLDELRAAKRKA